MQVILLDYWIWVTNKTCKMNDFVVFRQLSRVWVYHGQLHPIPNTVECRYNTIPYDMSVHAALQKMRQDINQRFYWQKRPHTSPIPRVSHRVSVLSISDKIDRIITAPHCIPPWASFHFRFIIQGVVPPCRDKHNACAKLCNQARILE